MSKFVGKNRCDLIPNMLGKFEFEKFLRLEFMKYGGDWSKLWRSISRKVKGVEKN